ncbi:MAG: electron transport complex subunit RsxC [Candidatus Omnitrophota bacterium]
MGETFTGGKHLENYKYLSKDARITVMPIPDQVIIPLSQHTGSITQPVVKKGDRLKVGTVIGTTDKFISAIVHSSVSGTVSNIVDYNHPVLGQSPSVIIDSDGKDERENTIIPRKVVDSLDKDKLLEIIKQAGIVGLGGAAFPTHVKLNPPNPVDTLVINGAECEPYLTCDYRLMIEHTNDILKGILLLKKILSVSLVLIGIEEDKSEAMSMMRNKIVERGLAALKVIPLQAKYPQGAEKQLIKATLDREVPSGKLPFDVGVVVCNVGTAYAVYEAVYLSKPLYERVITVTGNPIKNPSNLRVRIGTRFSEIISYCGLKTQAIGKIIMGGPMMGLAQFTDDVPVIKGTSGILLLSSKDSTMSEPGPCIRCGRCATLCPVGMLPYALSLCVEAKKIDQTQIYNAQDCMECGICTYVCPAKRKILESIRLVKAVMK